jgi:predicted RNA-binding protein YlqC (UPF0109 family)
MADLVNDKEYLEYVVRGIVNNPNDVAVERTVDEMGVLLTLKINPADMGYVIGREGSTARALRTLLRTVGAKNNARLNLKIYEPEGSRRPPRREYGAPAAPRAAASNISTEGVDELKI